MSDQPTTSNAALLSAAVIDQLHLGKVRCDFLSRADFWNICRQWLAGDHFHHVVTLNPEMVVQAETDVEFAAATAKANLRIPDGAGLVWAQWYIRSQFWALFPSLFAFSFRHVERIAGVEVVEELARMCAKKQQMLYLLGGTRAQVTGTAQRLRQQFPALHVAISPDHEFDVNGPPAVLADIQKQQPAVLLVAYGAPKQTLWIDRQRANLPSVRIAVGVGGAFAILSEERPRAPRWLRQLNLEWLWRLILEPSRGPRIWRAVVEFPRLIARQKKQTMIK